VPAVRLFCDVRELAQRLDPLAQLALAVEVVEALRGRSASRVPRPRVAPVEADVCDRRGRRDERRRNVRGVRLRRVDDDPRHLPFLEEAQELVAHVLRVPRPVARLEQERVAADLVARPVQVVERRRLPDDVRRHLEEDAAELARVAERRQRVEEFAEDGAARVTRRTVDASAVVDGQTFAQLGRHLLELHRMARHQPERLHVHDESFGRALRPAAHHLLGRHAVERRVDLHRRVALGVVREPFLRRRAGRIPVLREGVVGPRARPDPDRRAQR
jgi:hypothetical protein